MKLVQGMFDYRRHETFGLSMGQMRSYDKITHNSGWYNLRGEKIGWGDLGVSDFRCIKDNLEDGDAFIVLGESDSFWNFVTQPGITGEDSEVEGTEQNPGVEYILDKVQYFITKDGAYFVDRYGDSPELVNRDGLIIKGVTKEKAAQLLNA